MEAHLLNRSQHLIRGWTTNFRGALSQVIDVHLVLARLIWASNLIGEKLRGLRLEDPRIKHQSCARSPPCLFEWPLCSVGQMTHMGAAAIAPVELSRRRWRGGEDGSLVLVKVSWRGRPSAAQAP